MTPEKFINTLEAMIAALRKDDSGSDTRQMNLAHAITYLKDAKAILEVWLEE